MTDVWVTAEASYQLFLQEIWSTAPDGHDSKPYLEMFEHYAPDEEIHPGSPGSNWWLGLKHAPAARRNHHARIGGLVEHMSEMFRVYKNLVKEYPQLADPVQMTEWDVLRAIIHHDLHKGHHYYLMVSPHDPLLQGIEIYKDEVGMLLTDDQRSLVMLQNFDILLSPMLMNALFWSEGGWSENNRMTPNRPARPVLSVLTYLLDEFSGNVLERINKEDWTSVGTARRNQ